MCYSIDPDLQVQMRKKEIERDGMKLRKSETLVGCGEVHEETNLRLSGASAC